MTKIWSGKAVRVFLSILFLVCLAFGVVFAATKTVTAENSQNFYLRESRTASVSTNGIETKGDFIVDDEASARIAEICGLRFTTRIAKNSYKNLVALRKAGGFTFKFYTVITSINSSESVIISVDLEKIYQTADGRYAFDAVLGNIFPENYTRIFYADSYLEIMYPDNSVKTVRAEVKEDREGRSYAQIIDKALKDVSDVETQTATHYWGGRYYALDENAYAQAQGIYNTIKNTNITPILALEGEANNYATEIQGYFTDNPVKIGDILDFAALKDELNLPVTQKLVFDGASVGEVVGNRGFTLTVSIAEVPVIVVNGASDYVIVRASNVNEFISNQIKNAIQNTTKYTMSVMVDNGSINKDKIISIGDTSYAKAVGISAESVGVAKEDGFAIIEKDGNYYIVGGSHEGVAYGAYEFNRQILGVEYLTQKSADNYYPQQDVVYAEEICLVSDPDFDTRDFYAHIVFGEWASAATPFGFNSPQEDSDARITGGNNTYDKDYFVYYYGTETSNAGYYGGQKTTAHTAPIGHTVSELLAYTAAKEKGFSYGTKTKLSGGEQWLKGWEEWHPEWYAYDPNYKTRIAARNDYATDIDISSSTPNQVAANGRALLEICWTNGLNDDLTYTAGSANASGSVIEKLISICMKMIRDSKNSKAKYLELGFADYYVECQCEDCLAAYERFGGTSFTYNVGGYTVGGYTLGGKMYTSYWGGFGGVVANTVNEIAKAVKAQMANEGINREVTFVTLGYQRAILAPVNLYLDEDVAVRMCWRNCASHAINDTSCEHNQTKFAQMEAWNALTDEILIWDYTINFKNYLYYIPNYEAIQQNYQYYQTLGVTQVMTQASPWASNFYEYYLHQYVISKLMWDASVDVNTVINNFDKMYFGEYADAVAAYRSIMDTMYEENDIHTNTWGSLDFENPSKFEATQMKNAIAVLKAAIEEATAVNNTAMVKRLTSVLITPQMMLVKMNLVSGTERSTMIAELKANAALLGLEHYNEAGAKFADL